MIKYPKTPRVSTLYPPKWNKLDVVVSEKLDGANAGISFENKKLLIQSRGHILIGGPKEKQFALLKKLANENYNSLVDVLKNRYVLFGEWLYAKHKIFYDYLPGYFITYDLYDKENDIYLSTNKRTKLIQDLIFPHAPILHRGPFKKVNNFFKYIGPSKFKTAKWKDHLISLEHTDNSMLMEGVYIKIEDSEKVVGRLKLSRPEFEKIRDDDTDWLKRPIIKNILRK